MIVVVFLLLLISFCVPAPAQEIHLYVLDDSILIADKVTVLVEIRDISPPHELFLSFDEVQKDLSVQEVNEWQVDEEKAEVRFTVIPYDTGVVRIPAVGLVAARGGDTLWSNPVQMEVLPVVMDTSSIVQIKPIFREGRHWTDYQWVGGILLLLLLGLTGYMYFRRSREKEPAATPIVVKPAHQVALAKLEELRRKKLWEMGRIKEHQSELTYIIREYLESRYRIPALEMITPEILLALKKRGLTGEQQEQLAEVLQVADMIKFARATPNRSIHEAFIDRAENFVRHTTRLRKEV